MSKLLAALGQNPFVLAPMAGITDSPFRTFMKEQGCGIVVSELISAHGIRFKSENTLRLLRFDEVQRPVGIQLFGETPEVLAEGARFVEEQGADFVDLNFGCPVPKVVKKGAGSAILKDLVRLRAMLRAVKGAVSVPVTIKIRTGWDEKQRNAHEVVQVAYDEGITWVAIHGRTRSAGYSGLADWDYIADVKKSASLPILGNGDIADAEDAVARLRKSACNGVMIGRGCLKNPRIFAQSMELWRRQPGDSTEVSQPSYAPLILRLKSHFENHCDERQTAIRIKKFASWFSAGYPESGNFRKEVLRAQELTEVLDMSFRFFAGVADGSGGERQDTRSEAFLMGGHG